MASHFFGTSTIRSRSNSEPNDDPLREGVDFSEGGWATDVAAALVGVLYTISSYDTYADDDKHFLWMYSGTFVAHFFGGMAHRFFPNRAADGVGMTGFYVSMTLGYTGNCIRYGLGWGYDGLIFPVIALVNVIFFVVFGINCIIKMKRTAETVDNAEGSGFKPDTLFSFAEILASLMEVVATIIFLVSNNVSAYAIVGAVANIVGFVSVYAVGGLALQFGFDYDPGLMQRIFHYMMIIMLWGLDASVRRCENAN